jgi:hypothetical protein
MGGREVVIVSAAPSREKAIAALGVRHGKIEAPGRGEKLFIVSYPRGIDPSLLARYTAVILRGELVALVRTDQASADSLAGMGMRIKAVLPPPVERPLPSRASIRERDLAWDPWIQQIMDSVTQSDVWGMLGNLSGEGSVTIGGSSYTITTRNSYRTAAIEKATQYCYEYFQGQGLPVNYHYYSEEGYTCRNVVAVQVGAVNPGNLYIVCAHLDDLPDAPIAPGADDNASGSAAVLLTASLLSRYSFENTIRYVLFTGEEQGLYGSYYYVQKCADAGDTILGALNFDMIAYDGNGDDRMEVYCGTMPASEALGDLLLNTISTYSLSLRPVKYNTGAEGWSDHSSFWDAGYPALLGIEDNGDDFNPYYHTADDRRIQCNVSYVTGNVKAAVGTMARLAGPLSGPEVTPTPTPAPVPALVIDAVPEVISRGSRFTLNVSLAVDIPELFDFFLLADTPYGVYTLFFNGVFSEGIEPLYMRVPGYRAPYSAKVFNNAAVPLLTPGIYTFYAVAVEAGKTPPVGGLSELTPATPTVLAFAKKQVSLQ